MKFLKTIIVTLLIAGLLSVAQHHHDDFDSHEDCPICALVQDGLDISDNAPEVALFLVVICELTSQKCASKTNSHIHFYRPRGPPCLSA